MGGDYTSWRRAIKPKKAQDPEIWLYLNLSLSIIEPSFGNSDGLQGLLLIMGRCA